MDDRFIKANADMKKVAVLLLIVIPAACLISVLLFEIEKNPLDKVSFVIYYFMIFMAAAPLIVMSMEKNFIGLKKETLRNEDEIVSLFKTLTAIRIVTVFAVFFNGFFVYTLNGTFSYFFYFYILGTVWSYIFWPKESNVEKYMEKVKRYA